MTQAALLHQDVFHPYNPVSSESVFSDCLSHCFFNRGRLPVIDGHYQNFYRHYIEAENYPHIEGNLSYIHQEKPDISLCLSTQTAFSQPTAELFMQLLQRQFWLSDPIHEAVKTCLQESILNAIIHGNLDVHHDSGVLKDFEQYYARISQALQNPGHASKRLSIFAWRRDWGFVVAVCDQGNGFCLTHREIQEESTLPHGRGLMLIENFADRVWQATPNHLFMEFKHDMHSL